MSTTTSASASSASTSSTSASSAPIKYINMKDLSAFKWMIINIFGHDYMHDFLINTKRTSKEQTIIDQINKLISIIAKYKKKKKGIVGAAFGAFDAFSPSTGGGKKQKGGGGLDIPQNLTIKGSAGDLTEFTEKSIDSWANIDLTEYTKYSFHRLEASLNSHIEKSRIIMEKLKTGSSLSEEENEDLNIVKNEEKHIKEFIKGGMKKNFKALSELLISCFFSETISDMVESTSDINEYLSLNLTEENDDPDDIFFDGGSSQIDSKVTENSGEDGSTNEKSALGPNLDNSINNLNETKMCKNIFSKFGINIIGGGDIRGNLKGTTIAKEITEIGRMILAWETSKNDELLTLSSLKSEIPSSEVATSSPEQKQSSSSTHKQLIGNEINNVGLYNFTKKILLENIISNPINKKDPVHPYLFNPKTDDWILFEIAEKSQETMTIMFYYLYEDEILKNDDFTPEEDYDFFNKDEKYIILIDKYFTELKNKNINYTDDKETKYRDLYESVWGSLKGSDIMSIQTSLNNLFRFVVLYSHPDKFKDNYKDFATAKFSMILDAFKSIKHVYGLRGGGKKKSKEELKKEQKAFIGLNKLLGKTIIENSLSLMKCISGIKSHGYFPIINTKTTVSTDKTYKKFFSSYSGRKPRFISIFNGEGMKKIFTDQGYYDASMRGGINWTKICPDSYDELMTKDVGGAPLELRKLIARRILLNIQVLILYLRCSPTEVTNSKLLNALYLTIDKTPRDLNKHVKMTTNHWARGKDSTEIQKINNHFGISSTDEIPAEIKQFIQTNRTKWFGFMFDFYEDNPSAYNGFVPFVTSPEWLTSGTEDDALQYSFNIVLQKLLPEFIFYMGDSDIMKLPGFVKKDISTISTTYPLPKPFTEGETKSNNRNAYVINNAAKIYPSEQKMNESRFDFFNLSGENIREAQFCPITSIADNQPLCSVTTSKMADKTFLRSHNYDLEMGVEAEDAVGNTYSYIVNMSKSVARDNYFISAVLSIPGMPSIIVGDMGEKNDLKGSPLGAVTTYYHLLKNMNKDISQFVMRTSSSSSSSTKSSSPREILSDFFKENMETITNMCVKKSIGDYGQEHTASAKFGAGLPDEVKTAGQDSSGNNIVLPYTDDGDSLRIMLACDRPSAYRNIFMLLFSEENSVNSRAAAGYWDESEGKKSIKNTIVISPATLLPKDVMSRKINFNRSPNPDNTLGFPNLNSVPGSTVLGSQFRQENLRSKLRQSKRIQARVAFTLSQRVKIKRGFAKWLKDNETKFSKELPKKDDDTFTKKNKLIFLKNVFLREIGVSKGGRRKKTRKRRRRKRKTQRKKKYKKRKTNRKKKKKRRRTKRRKSKK
jgi:hypothetical protein